MKKKICFPFILRLAGAALFFTAVCLTFAGFPAYSPAVKAQFFPAVDRKAWEIVAVIIVLTILFGRFYCSVICPFGILQDIISFLTRRKSHPDANRTKTRYFIAALSFAAFIGGGICLIALLDPYSNFGRIASFMKNPSYVTGGIISAIILVLAVWKKRVFCTSVCPVGTLLGILAKFSFFKLRLSDKCVKCRKCVSVCPCGCVEPNEHALDNERCVKCLKCVAACPVKAIGFEKTASAPPQKTDLSKRQFLTGSLTTAAAVGTGVIFALRTRPDDLPEEKRPVCPPGATTWQEFSAKCTNCQLCVAGCSGRVLRPKSKRYQTVHLEYGENYCLYGCHKCSSVCPTGALKPLTLTEKQNRRIGLAEFSTDKCVGCGLCADTCPKGAIDIIEIDGDDKARIDANKCIGCGACVAQCPLPEKAVHIIPVAVQTPLP